MVTEIAGRGTWKELDIGFDEAAARLPTALQAEGFGIITQIRRDELPRARDGRCSFPVAWAFLRELVHRLRREARERAGARSHEHSGARLESRSGAPVLRTWGRLQTRARRNRSRATRALTDCASPARD